MESSSSGKILLKPLKVTIFWPNLCKNGVTMGHTQIKKQIFFSEIIRPDLSFQNLFILTKYHMFWLSYECFSILCNAFLLKSPISSHNSCVTSVPSHHTLTLLEKLWYFSSSGQFTSNFSHMTWVAKLISNQRLKRYLQTQKGNHNVICWRYCTFVPP